MLNLFAPIPLGQQKYYHLLIAILKHAISLKGEQVFNNGMLNCYKNRDHKCVIKFCNKQH